MLESFILLDKMQVIWEGAKAVLKELTQDSGGAQRS